MIEYNDGSVERYESYDDDNLYRHFRAYGLNINETNLKLSKVKYAYNKIDDNFICLVDKTSRHQGFIMSNESPEQWTLWMMVAKVMN